MADPTARKRAQADRQRAAGRRPLSLWLPVDLIDWLDTDAHALGQSRAERIENLLREQQQTRDHGDPP